MYHVYRLFAMSDKEVKCDENKNMMKIIYFYSSRENGCYFYLSNFFKSPIKLHDKIWPTTESYYQAMKFMGTDLETTVTEEIRLAPTPSQAKKIAYRYDKTRIRSDWDDVKDKVMLECVRAKFMQNETLEQKLLDTIGSHLLEDSPDAYWGGGKDPSKTGLNKLGRILEQVRGERLTIRKRSTINRYFSAQTP